MSSLRHFETACHLHTFWKLLCGLDRRVDAFFSSRSKQIYRSHLAGKGLEDNGEKAKGREDGDYDPQINRERMT